MNQTKSLVAMTAFTIVLSLGIQSVEARGNRYKQDEAARSAPAVSDQSGYSDPAANPQGNRMDSEGTSGATGSVGGPTVQEGTDPANRSDRGPDPNNAEFSRPSGPASDQNVTSGGGPSSGR